MNSTLDIVYEAMNNIGEETVLATIHEEVCKIDPNFPKKHKKWKSAIGSAIYSNSSDVEKFWTPKKP